MNHMNHDYSPASQKRKELHVRPRARFRGFLSETLIAGGEGDKLDSFEWLEICDSW